MVVAANKHDACDINCIQLLELSCLLLLGWFNNEAVIIMEYS